MVASTPDAWFEKLKTILVELARSEVVEFELVQDGTRIYLRKDGRPPAIAAAPVVASGHNGQDGHNGPGRNGHLAVCSPLTGLFHLTPSPSAPPYVRVGDQVEAGQIVGLLEAMKVFSEIRTENRGRVASILTQSGQLVQKGQVLLQLAKE